MTFTWNTEYFVKFAFHEHDQLDQINNEALIANALNESLIPNYLNTVAYCNIKKI
jgi:hypothetical protein